MKELESNKKSMWMYISQYGIIIISSLQLILELIIAVRVSIYLTGCFIFLNIPQNLVYYIATRYLSIHAIVPVTTFSNFSCRLVSNYFFSLES